MPPESDRIPDRVACLNTGALPAALVSTRGFNCDVWQSAGMIVRDDGRREPVNFVVKRHRFPCPLPKVRAFQREYRRLRGALEEMVPPAIFVATRVNDEPNLVVLAEARPPWFDLARPGNDEEARPLLAKMPRARRQLARFVDAARRWAEDGLVIDLYGSENLVLGRDRQVSYLDSFGVFFYEDTLHAVDGADEEFAERIAVSRRRLEYVASLVGKRA